MPDSLHTLAPRCREREPSNPSGKSAVPHQAPHFSETNQRRLPSSTEPQLERAFTLEQVLARTSDIRIDEAEHGPAGARRFEYEPTYMLSGVKALHMEFDPV
ncbi:hypothetical protein [Novosphingobium album (ex Liu et al. 2023)]|uniref:Uncharacterized protein n=1 Tax=Novosphingobium album (ex Liu et al. 2023) TaxID=3031130 RepID=A0ABT5WT03_9SPHN|nr:hypothetical protein [Novosphingobium album (ex Liu et al. 2023)]MDE8653170.1 hypothetical protein [Novosphingobium album (ex Liu et al. 2023)]